MPFFSLGCRAMNNKFAKIIRVITIPPLVVSFLALILWLTKFITLIDAIYVVCLLGLVCLLAYPLSFLFDKNVETRRKTMRKTSFIFTFVGYLIGFILSFVVEMSEVAVIIFQSYFVSAFLLLITNVLKFKASGHMTSITGPLAFFSYYLPHYYVIIPCLLMYAVVFWSSLTLKRHTWKEMAVATLIVLFSFFAIQLLH